MRSGMGQHAGSASQVQVQYQWVEIFPLLHVQCHEEQLILFVFKVRLNGSKDLLMLKVHLVIFCFKTNNTFKKNVK